jgi:hypothetical protein
VKYLISILVLLYSSVSFGYYIFPGSTAGHYSRANGSGGWLSVGILTSDLPGLVTPGGCTNCSVTFNAEGQATAFSSGGGGGITYAAISSNVTLSANTLNGVDTSSPRSLTMPAPVSGVVVELKDITGTASTNNITINPNGSEKVEFGSNYVVGNNAFGASFFSNGVDWFIRYIYQPVFIAATCVGCSTSYYNNIEVMAWAPSGASGATGSFTVSSAPQGTAFEFFLEGGGGGGGTYGGGAGAYPVYLTGQVAAVTTYPITIGAGGPGDGGGGGIGTQGYSSTFFSQTATGGGYGGYAGNGGNGSDGGGGGSTGGGTTGGTGTFAGGTGNTVSGGGGAGCGAVGGNASLGYAGNGGNGCANSLATGSSQNYGGGGGGYGIGVTEGTGGLGGGGTAANPGNPGTVCGAGGSAGYSGTGGAGHAGCLFIAFTYR